MFLLLSFLDARCASGEAIRDRRDEILTETCTETLSGGRGVMR